VDSAHKLPFVAIDLVRQSHNTVMIETFLPGREFSVAVCGSNLYRHGLVTSENQPFAFSVVERILGPNEAIFTSMDTKAITSDRLRALVDDQPEKGMLMEIARTIYTEFNLGSLIRIDIRADKNRVFHVLEANPKPDLSKGDQTRVGLITSHLAQSNLTYTDLIVSLLIDRLDYLFRYTPQSITHLVEMLA
jgi:D-alanine-D-alanine ligase